MLQTGTGKHGSNVAGNSRGAVRYGLVQAKPAPKDCPTAKLSRSYVCQYVDPEPMLSAMDSDSD